VNWIIAWFRPEPPGDAEVAADALAAGDVLAAGLLVVPATPPLELAAPQAATTKAPLTTNVTSPPRKIRDMFCPPL
jgi:hypothetical protein